jgi:hypothetical protein
MARNMRWLGAVGRAALVTAAVGATITVAACGSRAAASQPAPAGGAAAASMPGDRAVAGVALCSHMQQLTSVVVSRTTTLHVLEPADAPPTITIADPRPVRGLAAALCRLPAMPRGTVNCPAQFRDSLRLTFAAGRRPFPPVTIQVSGCRAVSGLGPARTASSAAFWRTLDKDLSLPSPQNTSQPAA